MRFGTRRPGVAVRSGAWPGTGLPEEAVVAGSGTRTPGLVCHPIPAAITCGRHKRELV